MQTQATDLRIEDGIAWISMDDGKVNALSEALICDLETRLDEAQGAADVVVLVGRPGIFSAGFDLATFARGLEPTVSMLRSGARIIERFLGFPRPIITACGGHAYPMGAFLMLAADLRFGVRGEFRIGMN